MKMPIISSLTITHKRSNVGKKLLIFGRNLYFVVESYSMHVRPLFNVGGKNCPTWKRKNKNHTINAKRKQHVISGS